MSNNPAIPKSAFDFVALDANKQEFPLSQFRGHPVLIVNVASEGGFTQGAWDSANALYKRYKDRGFVILAFPCSQFANQAPGNDEDIQHNIISKFHAEFPVLGKVDVNGDDASPLWKWLKHQRPGLLGTEFIKWNFTSFLIDGNGQVVQRFMPGIPEKEIEAALIPVLALAPAAGGSSTQVASTTPSGVGYQAV